MSRDGSSALRVLDFDVSPSAPGEGVQPLSIDAPVDLEAFATQLRNLPITINALADPAILRESSARKLDMLVEDRHVGPVAIVTKGNLDTDWWRQRLSNWCKHLDLHIFASISGLPKSYEPVPLEPRFRTLRAARDAGAKAIAYIRPIVPGVNDSHENLQSLVEKAADHGCHAVVSSGFRGSSPIVEDSGFSQKGKTELKGDWLPSVKLHTTDTEEFLRSLCAKLAVGFWTGTSCAVAGLSKGLRSLSPYHIAPQFARCDVCPGKSSCYDKRHEMKPLPGSLELLRHLGYRVKFDSGSPIGTPCNVQVRSTCSLHCTNCKKAPQFQFPHVTVRRWDDAVPTWGDLCLARFLTGGMVCTDDGLSEKEESTINLHPRFGFTGKGVGSLYATTSWMMWSEYLPKEKCFRCSYCFVGMYKDALPAPMQGTVGISPLRILHHGENHG